MNATSTASSISCRACIRAMPSMARSSSFASCALVKFMGALLGLVRVGAASVSQAGRPPFAGLFAVVFHAFSLAQVQLVTQLARP